MTMCMDLPRTSPILLTLTDLHGFDVRLLTSSADLIVQSPIFIRNSSSFYFEPFRTLPKPET